MTILNPQKMLKKTNGVLESKGKDSSSSRRELGALDLVWSAADGP